MDSQKTKGKASVKNLPIISYKIFNEFTEDNFLYNFEIDTNENIGTSCFENIKKNRGSILQYLEKSNEIRKRTDVIDFSK